MSFLRIAPTALLLLWSGLSVAQEITKLPALIEDVQPEFPEAALRDRVAARVKFEFTITATGTVEGISLVESSTRAEAQPDGRFLTDSSTVSDYGFVAAGQSALERFRFEPAEADGEPIPVRITYSFNFDLPPPPIPVEIEGEEVPRVVNFQGLLRERGTRRRIPGAVVTVFRESTETSTQAVGFEAISDEEGQFRFTNLEVGPWRVLVEKEGYFPYRTTEQILINQLTEVTYFVEAGSYNPYDVTVTAERPFKEVQRRVLRPERAARIPGSFGDPISAVQNLPGVARAPAGAGALPVRGSAPGDTGILFEGIETPFIFHFGALRSVVPGEFIESVEFIPGNFSTYYGRFSSGILDVQLKDLDAETVTGKTSIGLLEGQLFTEIPIGKNLSIAAGVRRSWIDLVIEAVAPDDGSIDIIAAPVYTDYQVLANYRPGRAHDLRLFFFGSRDRFEFINRDAQEANIQLTSGGVDSAVGFNRVLLQYDYRPNQRFTNELQIGFGLDEIAIAAFDVFEFNLDNYQWQLRDRMRFKLSDRFSLDVGTDSLIRLSDIDLLIPNPDQDPLNPDLNDTVSTSIDGQADLLAGFYAEATIDVSKKLSLVPGVRLDVFERAGEVALDPRIIARYRLFDKWTLVGGVGSFSQPPAPQNLNETVGNPEVSAFRAFQASTGVEWDPFPYLGIDVTFFYKQLFDLIGTSDDFRVDDEGNTVPALVENNETGRVFGLELYVDHKFNKNFQGFLSYTLSRSTRDPEGEPTQLFDFDQTHIFVMAGSYVFPQNWELGIRWRVISGSPDTPIVAGSFNGNQGEYSPIFGDANSERLPFFHQLDIRLDKRWIYKSFTLGAFLEVLNAYNNPNVEGFTYNFDFSERDRVQSLPIIPNLGFEARF
ncbi:MAG: TonB-dependent receptor [Myxococcota bacterium]